ncbi:MAG: hypothetical protein LC114_01460 [Bryobacterales bacterium]|nr:hypothetical protein [Bryobacterales bacterium]
MLNIELLVALSRRKRLSALKRRLNFFCKTIDIHKFRQHQTATQRNLRNEASMLTDSSQRTAPPRQIRTGCRDAYLIGWLN